MDEFIRFKKIRIRKSSIAAYYPDTSFGASLDDKKYVVMHVAGTPNMIRVSATVEEVDAQIGEIK